MRPASRSGAANWAERSISFNPSRAGRGAVTFCLRHKQRRQIMIKLHKPIAGGFSAAILVMCVLALSAPASAKGGGGGGGGGGFHGSRGPGRPPPAAFLDRFAAGRAGGRGCSLSPQPGPT